jgi:hypothetical protein
MQGVFQNLIGTKSGKLTVIDGPFSRDGKQGKFWLCQCDCGKTLDKLIVSNSLIHKKTQSCGCFMVEQVKKSNTTHGFTKTRSYVSWRSMWQRCTDPSHKNYKSYKTKTPVDRWKSFEMFLLDMGERPKGMSLERIDNSKNYSPENCKWATNRDQQLNREATIALVIDGVKMSMREACRTLGVGYSMAKGRVYKGWNPYDAVLTPKLR